MLSQSLLCLGQAIKRAIIWLVTTNATHRSTALLLSGSRLHFGYGKCVCDFLDFFIFLMIQARASVCLSNRISFAYICILTNRSDSPPNQLLLPAQCLSTHYHLPFLNRIQINDNMYLHGQCI